jgi:16S rRNA (cytosine967-C5)-methyltransferase
MTPAARAQAAIELLDQIITAAAGQGAAADTIIQRYFKERRYAGSKDRRAVRDLVYAAIRAHVEPPVNGRSAMIGLARQDAALAAHFDGSRHGPAPIAPDEMAEAGRGAGAMPTWLAPHLAALVDALEQAALLGRAPLHVRVNALKTSREEVCAALRGATPLDTAPHGLALPEGTSLEATVEWQAGLIEVQDAGSQFIAAACSARPGQTVLDLCAGAGGKTLALAADMGGAGRLIAADINRERLSRRGPALNGPGPVSSRRCSSTAGARPRRWRRWRAPATACWSMRLARAWGRGGAIPRRAGVSPPKCCPAPWNSRRASSTWPRRW